MSKKVFTIKSDGSMLTPEFRVSFPKIFSPDDKNKFGLAMLFPKETTDISVLMSEVDRVVKEKYPKGAPDNLMRSVHDGDTKTREEQEGMWYVNAKAGKYRPGLIDQNLQPIVDEAEFYPGCWARAVVNVFSWEDPKHGTKGISVGVRNIQKIRDDEPLISRVKAEDEFGAVQEPETTDL